MVQKTEDQGPVLSGPEVIGQIREETDTVFLGFSCGKDSLAAWLKLREQFDKIVPFYMYLVPDLEFIEESLTRYEEFFETRIHRLPHPSIYRMWNNLVYQAPQNIRTIEAARFPKPDYDTLADLLAEDLGYDSRPWTATGVRAADSPIRRANIKQHGAVNHNRHTFFPVWDMKIAELRSLVKDSGVKLPVDYRYFGRSFDGIDRRFLEPMREHLPRDYNRVLEMYPLAEVDILRKQFATGEVVGGTYE